MFKIDFHTHSLMSSDGGITEKEYEEIIAKKILDVVAITDHNRIDFAQKMHKKLGDVIIVGEEVKTTDGEIIGLFLRTKVGPWSSLEKAILEIHEQKGLVYIPHPFDRTRHGIGMKNLLTYKDEIDIIEGFNGRILFPWQNSNAWDFAKTYALPVAAASDAHSKKGIGKAYTCIEKIFTPRSPQTTLLRAIYVKEYQPPLEYLRPKWNRIKRVLWG